MIVVLRLGHRRERDKRLTTHVALTARSFGADRVVIAEKDSILEKTVREVVEKFGGDFEIESGVDWRRFLKDWKGPIVHLTMYGELIDDVIGKIPKEDLLIVVGAEKVPREVYERADFNVAVGNQPHSEVAALAVFLDRLLEGKGLRKEFGGKLRILPSKKGKLVLSGELPSEEECIQILKEVGCDEDLINHSIVVSKLAEKLAELSGADVRLVKVAGLLHDIGRCKTNSVEHAVIGAKILSKMVLPERLVRIVERHVGGGIDEEEARKLNLPPKDYSPQTLEEKIVAHADNLIDGVHKVQVSEEVDSLKKEGMEKGAKKILVLHRELCEKCGLDLDELELEESRD